MRGWFVFDFVATLPVEYMMSASDAGGSELSRLARLPRAVRLLRLFRLVKLARLTNLAKSHGMFRVREGRRGEGAGRGTSEGGRARARRGCVCVFEARTCS